MSINSFFNKKIEDVIYKAKELPNTFNTFLKNKSENTLLNNVVTKYAQGNAKTVESSYVLEIDPNAKSSFDVIKSLRAKKVHVINDKNLIVKLLHHRRNDALLSLSFPNVGLNNDNMLTCPFSQHRKLRSPVEKHFKQNELRDKHFNTQASRIANTIISTLKAHSCISLYFDRSIHSGIICDLLGLDYNYDMSSEISQNNLDKAWTDHILPAIDDNKYTEGKIVDTLVKQRDQSKLSNEELKDTILVLLLAGHHTTSKFVEQLEYELMDKSSVRELVRTEWDDFITAHKLTVNDEKSFIEHFKLFVTGGKINDVTLQPSVWISAILMESLRLFPTIPIIKRMVSNDFETDGYSFKKGDLIDLNILSSQRNEAEWSHNSNEFDPTRHVENGKLKKKSDLLNFGLGSQMCVGKELAKQQVEIIIGMTCLLVDDLKLAQFRRTLRERVNSIPSIDNTNFGLTREGIAIPKYEITGTKLAKKIFSCKHEQTLTPEQEKSLQKVLQLAETWYDLTKSELKSYEKQLRIFAQNIIANNISDFKSNLSFLSNNFCNRTFLHKKRSLEFPTGVISSFGMPPG